MIKKILNTILNIMFCLLMILFCVSWLYDMIKQYKWWLLLIVPALLIVEFLILSIITFGADYIYYVKDYGTFKGYLTYLKNKNRSL